MKSLAFPPYRLWTPVLLLAFLACSGPDEDPPGGDADTRTTPVAEPNGLTPCENGMAGPYPCSGLDLVSHLGLTELNAVSGNDIWGWVDPLDGTEYALVGLDNGTAFLSLESPENPIFLGKLPTRTTPSTWRDIKVYRDHAYIVSEASGHGMQVFDLTTLRDVASPPVIFAPTAVYSDFGNAHNIVINETSGFAYAVGTGQELPYQGGPHFIDLADPANPVGAGGYAVAGYTHDAQVVTYQGPDTDYAGHEIFVGANESRVVILDVTDKSNPTEIGGLSYPNLGYTHQGWFTGDHRYFILGDETDELDLGFNSRTLVFDFTDLDSPFLSFTYSGPTTAIDHNGYVAGDLFYLANYTAGVRVADLSGIGSSQMIELAFFDTFPASDSPGFNGVWSVYPFLPSGLILAGDINSGFFAVRPSDPGF